MTKNKNKKIKIINLIQSVFAAFFGVQSSQARERDFNHGKPLHYIIGGLIFVTLFVLILSGIVALVMQYIAK